MLKFDRRRILGPVDTFLMSCMPTPLTRLLSLTLEWLNLCSVRCGLERVGGGLLNYLLTRAESLMHVHSIDSQSRSKARGRLENTRETGGRGLACYLSVLGSNKLISELLLMGKEEIV